MRWEIYIPDDWKFGQWEAVRLYSTPVDILVVKCETCGEIFRVYPSFIINGTTLTLTALIFIAFTYEYSNLTWRDLPIKFCDKYDKIAHSTLFKAVQGIGKSIIDNENKIKKGIAELAEKFLLSTKDEPETRLIHPLKSRYEHTILREKGLRKLLEPLLPLKDSKYESRLTLLFYKYMRIARTVFSNIDPPVTIIYKK